MPMDVEHPFLLLQGQTLEKFQGQTPDLETQKAVNQPVTTVTVPSASVITPMCVHHTGDNTAAAAAAASSGIAITFLSTSRILSFTC